MSSRATSWTGPALGADLLAMLAARHWIGVQEIALCDRLTHRADVVAMLASGHINRVDIYELKVQRSDLLGDLRRDKWRAYLAHGRVWFAFPIGLADPKEIPLEAGVIVRQANCWRRVRAPAAFVGPPPTALMRRLVMAVRSQRAPEPQPRKATLWEAERRARAGLGRTVAKVASDLQFYAQEVERLRAEHLRLTDQIADAKRALRSLDHEYGAAERAARQARRPQQMALIA